MPLVYKWIIILLAVVSSVFAASIQECTHLLQRSTFGVAQQDLTQCLQSDYASYVHRFVYANDAGLSTQPPKEIRTLYLPPKRWKEMTRSERKQYRKALNRHKMLLKAWYMQEIVHSKSPLIEHMTLFWHNHFTSSLRKVKQPSVMLQQHLFLRKHALGNYKEMVRGIIKDPAMLIYLDNRQNKKSHPNENLARELLELFTLGEGNYDEADVKAMAKALTGYSIDKNMHFKFRHKWHDRTKKYFLGFRGDFDADDLLAIVFKQQAFARHIVKKLWMFYVGEPPNQKELQKLAQHFDHNNFEIRPLLEEIFLSESFRSQANYAKMIKSPIELAVGTYRALRISPDDGIYLARASRRMGQDPFDPPNVKGWREGKAWITGNTLLEREAFLQAFSRTRKLTGKEHLFSSAPFFADANAAVAHLMLPVETFMFPAKHFDKTLESILRHPLYELK